MNYLIEKFKEDKIGFIGRLLIFLMIASFVVNIILIYLEYDNNFCGLFFDYFVTIFVTVKFIERKVILNKTAVVFLSLFFMIQIAAFTFNLTFLKVFAESGGGTIYFAGIIIPVVFAAVFELIYRIKYFANVDKFENVESDADTESVENRF